MAEEQLEIESSLIGDDIPEVTAEELDNMFAPTDDPDLDPDAPVVPTEVPLVDDESVDPPATPPKPTGEEGDDEPGAYVPGSYLKSLNENYDLKMEMDRLPDDLTVDQEMATVQQIMTNRDDAYKARVSALESYDALMTSDEDTQTFLKARAEGKTLKDIVADLSETAQYSAGDNHVENYLKTAFGLEDKEVGEEIQRMKDAGVYEDRKAKIQAAAVQKEQATNEAADLATKQAIKAEQEAYDAGVKEYASFIQEQDGIGDFKFTAPMKKELINHATILGEEGYTQLERDVQSRDNALKASVAIKYWSEIVKVLSTVASESSKNDLLSRLTETDPTRLQSSTSSNRKPGEFDDVLANAF